MTTSAIRACAEIISGIIQWKNSPAICNLARCGATYCADITTEDGVYSGMIPVKLTASITAALTENPGSHADPRQRYDVAFDNPAMTLHILGDDLVRIDKIAAMVLKLDRSAHIETQWGTVNGLRVNPPKRTVRNDRPRYDVQLIIDMEMVR